MLNLKKKKKKSTNPWVNLIQPNLCGFYFYFLNLIMMDWIEKIHQLGSTRSMHYPLLTCNSMHMHGYT